MKPVLVLASASPSRRSLLEQLKVPFDILPADINESQQLGEQPMDLVERLSTEKALAVAHRIKQQSKQQDQSYIVIGSDQVAVFNNQVYGKPGNFKKAQEQLQLFNNHVIEFITGLCVIKLTPNEQDQVIYTKEISKIKLKNLSNEQITSYLNKEQPYGCAASFKIEGLGISLVESIDTRDFNAIIGLPIIQLIYILNKLNLDILS